VPLLQRVTAERLTGAVTLICHGSLVCRLVALADHVPSERLPSQSDILPNQADRVAQVG
jgi:antitoxin (DNA-binding transcriptional repressor) of toxin-antitoxin stability system